MIKVQPDIKLTSALLKTFQSTLPLLLSDEDDCPSGQVNFGELLFPNFNHLVVQMCDQLPHFDETLLSVFSQMVAFAFKT